MGAVLVWGPKQDPNLENYVHDSYRLHTRKLGIDQYNCFKGLKVPW